MSYKYICPFCHNEVPIPLYSPVFGEEKERPMATCEHCNLTLPVFVWMKLFEGDRYKEEHHPETTKMVEIEEKLYEKRKVEDWEQTYGIEHKHEYNPAYVTCPFCGSRHTVRNIDLWNGISCPCGAIISEEGQEVYATKEK